MNEKVFGKKIKLNDFNMTYGKQEKLLNVMCLFKYKKDNNMYAIYCDDSSIPYGIINYGTAHLKENTLIKDRESIEVNLFEEYMIFAQIMGISEKVAKQFKDIYPEIITESNFVSYEYIMHINMSSRIGLSVAISASRMDKIMADNYSSGGGGYSSGGGGGGSFGGGGGGRRFPLKFIYHVTRRTELMVKS